MYSQPALISSLPVCEVQVTLQWMCLVSQAYYSILLPSISKIKQNKYLKSWTVKGAYVLKKLTSNALLMSENPHAIANEY